MRRTTTLLAVVTTWGLVSTATFAENKALELDLDEFARAPHDVVLESPEAITVEGWVRFEGIQVFNGHSLVQKSPAPSRRWALRVNPWPGASWSIDNGMIAGGSLDGNASGPRVPNDRWTHLAGVATETSVFLYVDGVLVDSDECDITCRPLTDPGALLMGTTFNGAPTRTMFIDEVRVWDVVRTSEEIRDNMNCTVPEDSLGLVAYYRFDEDDDDQVVLDSSLRGNHATLGANVEVDDDDPRRVPSTALSFLDCRPGLCGNGMIDPPETCDDGNDEDGDGCDSNCTATGCGNGIVTPPEDCDDRNQTDGDGCRVDCTLEICGDSILDPQETCDDGNDFGGDGCRADCTLEICGDGILDPQETCDDGNLMDDDGCDANCALDTCGDGIVDPHETCDDGNQASGDGCRADCMLEICGDGILDPEEACDDGNDADGDGCDSNCTPTGCGNGVVTPPETCDDGNLADGDGCRGDCTSEVCGDGIVDPGEDCDDANGIDDDGCDNSCMLIRCFREDMETGAPGWSHAMRDLAKIGDPPGPETWHLATTTCRGEALGSSMYVSNGNAGPTCIPDSARERSQLVGPPIPLPSRASVLALRFDALSRDEAGACTASATFDKHDVGISVDGGATYVLLNDCTALADGAGNRITQQYDLTAWVGRQVQFVFVYDTVDASHGHTFAVDDVLVLADDCSYCGDGTIDPGEACDDGNETDGDGCSAACQLDCADGDGDGFGSPASSVCAGGEAPDCNDDDPAINPGRVEDCDNGIDDNCDGLVDTDDSASCDPMVVHLIRFAARVNGQGDVVLVWQTAAEIDNVGFRILRRDGRHRRDALVVVGPDVIPSRGDESHGSTYTFVDRPAFDGRVSYWLESIDLEGERERFGPVIVDLSARRHRTSR